jgi:tetratricopeptide (TPR) repeat protein
VSTQPGTFQHADAERELGVAIAQDRNSTQAHVELGALFLSLGGDKIVEAAHEFRRALVIEPALTSAGIGLAQALASMGADLEAESALRRVLQHLDVRKPERWRLHVALGRLLIQRGDKQQNSALHAEAYSQAQKAIKSAPNAEADPYYVAGVACHRMCTPCSWQRTRSKRACR